MRRSLLLIKLLVLPAAVGAMSTTTLTREQLLDIACERSPKIARAAAEWRATTARVRQARLYPNPELDVEQSDLRFAEDSGMTSAAIGQPIIIGGRRDREVDLAKLGVARAEAELQLAVRETLAQVDRLHVRVVYHHADIASQFELLDEAEATLEAAEAKRMQGADQQYLKARIERDRIQLEVTRHSAELVYTLQDLSVALGGEELRADSIVGTLTSDYAVTKGSETLVEQHPRRRVAMLVQSEEEARSRVLGRAWIPDVTVRVGAGWDEANDETVPFAGLRIPLPLWNRNQGSIEESTARADALSRTVHEVELELTNAVRFNVQQLNEFDTFVTEYRTSILPGAKQALDETRTRYSEGAEGYLDVLDSQRVYTEARAAYYQYLLRYNELLAERRALEGYPQEQQLERFSLPAQDAKSPPAPHSDP
jgi:cobalt-zinc-cadmium efflux system outer membrane protein